MNEGELGMQRAVGRMFSVECQSKQYGFYPEHQGKTMEDFSVQRCDPIHFFFLNVFLLLLGRAGPGQTWEQEDQ